MSERRTLRCAEDQSRLDLCYGIPGQTELAPLGRVIIKPKAHAKWAVSMQHGVICTYQLPSFGVALLNARARCSKSRSQVCSPLNLAHCSKFYKLPASLLASHGLPEFPQLKSPDVKVKP
ncbi:hypothetical protein CGGC5_v011869 [Colletotrichum fructicola Nara gc5]|uniref:Uncharacterized protein n=1 Tax=Colletotrichum fructicola (strain Nara gc5) TaxID=1213859 RepID=A0A7J6IS21_COLFN|nr:hypothetical protein CGGC5_v011869 [Colletotrichum fructicola Nara gc5]